MSATLFLVSYSIHGHINVGAYQRPYSGVGIEFDPLDVKPGRSGLVLHEAGYLKDNRDWNFPSVFSPFWRLYYNQKGGHCVLFDERIVELTPRHIMLIPPHCMFHCLGSNPVRTFWLAFSFSRSLDKQQPLPILLRPRRTELCLIHDVRRLIQADHSWAPTEPILRHSIALLHVVLSRSELHWHPSLPANMERVRVMIERNLAGRLRNIVLAREAGLGIAGFERTFKRCFGTTAARYVAEMRIREAARLLLQTDATIEAIAERAGFPNRAYFSRVFAAITNESPARFRRKHCRLHTDQNS